MPTVEGRVQPREKTGRSELAPDLFVEKQKLFDELREREGDIDLSDKAKLVSRILEHSVDDGLNAASMFGLSAHELREQTTRIGFLLKHEKLIEKVTDEVEKELRGDATISEWIRYAGVVKFTPDINDPSAGVVDLFQAEKKFLGPQSLKSPLAQELCKKIDELYAKFLRIREIKTVAEMPPIPPLGEPGQKDGVQMAEEHLLRVESAQLGHYTSEGLRRIVLDAFFDTLPDEERWKAKQRNVDPLSDPKLKDRFIKWFRALPMKPRGEDPLKIFASNAFFKASFGEGVVSIFTDTNDPHVKKKFEQAKYKVHETVAAVGEQTAKRKLIQEIKISLQQKGFDPEKIAVEPTGSNGEYEVTYAPGTVETKEEAFDWDLDTFQKTERTYGDNPLGSRFVAAKIGSDGAAVISEGRFENYLSFLSKDKKPIEIAESLFVLLGEINGTVISLAQEKSGLYKVMEKDHAIPFLYREVYKETVIEADGTLAFVARTDDGRLVINHNGKEIELNPSIKKVSRLQFDHGTFWYLADKGNETEITNGRGSNPYLKFPHGRTTVKDFLILNNRVAIVEEDSKNGKTSVDLAGTILFTSPWKVDLYKSTSNELIVKEKVSAGPQQLIFPDGSGSDTYEHISPPSEIDGEMVFLVQKHTKEFALYYSRQDREEVIAPPPISTLRGMHTMKIHAFDSGVLIEQYGELYDAQSGQLVLKNPPPYDRTAISINEDKVTVLFSNSVGSTSKVTLYEKERQKVTRPIETKMALTMEEEKRIMLLNAMRVQHQDIPTKEKTDAIKQYFQAYPVTEKKPILGQRDVDAINKNLKEQPEIFLDTMAAVPDRRFDRRYIESIADRLFPEIARLRAKRKRESLVSRIFRRGNGRAETYLTPHAEGGMDDGDPTDPNPQEVMRFREVPPTMVITRTVGKYDQETGKWTETDIPFAPHLGEPTREYTAEITALKGLKNVLLPVMAGAEIIPERVKAIGSDGEETPLTIRQGAGGQTIVNIDVVWNTPKSIAYSQRLSELPPVPSDISAREFERWKKEFTDQFGTDLTEPLAYLPAEINVFLDSIAALTPKEKMAAIETYVRGISYYDFDNREVMEEKRDSTLAERFGIMKSRMEELKGRADPKMRGLLKKKQFAGVCLDFNLLIVTMLRKSGIPAGMAIGFRPDSTLVTTNDAHASAFAVYPEEHTKRPQMILVDGTPGGVTAEEQVMLALFQFPSLEEQEEIYDQKIERIVGEAEEVIREILATIEQHDEQSIRTLTNGQLESALNIILRYEVKQSHVSVLRQMFNVAEYSPAAVRNVDLFKLQNRVAFLSWIKQSVASTRAETERADTTDKPAGSQLMDLVQEFEQRFAKSFASDRDRAFDLMQLIVDTSADNLSKTEQRAATAVITYLKAKQMIKKR